MHVWMGASGLGYRGKKSCNAMTVSTQVQRRQRLEAGERLGTKNAFAEDLDSQFSVRVRKPRLA